LSKCVHVMSFRLEYSLIAGLLGASW
jgi:hypothetical protein